MKNFLIILMLILTQNNWSGPVGEPARFNEASRWLQRVNEERAKHGASPLVLDDRLCRAALWQAADCARRELALTDNRPSWVKAIECLEHTGTDGSRPKDRAMRFGFTGPVSEGAASTDDGKPAGLDITGYSPHHADMIKPHWKYFGYGRVEHYVFAVYGLD